MHIPYILPEKSLTTLIAQDNIHSDPALLVSLREGEIDTLLPSSEPEFDSGHEPRSRETLEGTQVPGNFALQDCSRSLFASLIQIRHYWGTVARRVIRNERDPDPWDRKSYFSGMSEKLNFWEEVLPDEHKWDASFLRRYGSVGQDMVRLCTLWELLRF